MTAFTNDVCYYISRAIKRLSSFDDIKHSNIKRKSYEFVNHSWRSNVPMLEQLVSRKNVAVVVGAENSRERLIAQMPTIYDSFMCIVTLGLIPDFIDEIYFLVSIDRRRPDEYYIGLNDLKNTIETSKITLLYNGSKEDLGPAVINKYALKPEDIFVDDTINNLINIHAPKCRDDTYHDVIQKRKLKINCSYSGKLSEKQALIASQHVLACALHECVTEYCLVRYKECQWLQEGKRFDNGLIKRAVKYLTMNKPELILGDASLSGKRVIMPFGMTNPEAALFCRDEISRYDEPKKNLERAEIAAKLAAAHMLTMRDEQPEREFYQYMIVPRRSRESLSAYRERIGYEETYKALKAGVSIYDLFNIGEHTV